MQQQAVMKTIQIGSWFMFVSSVKQYDIKALKLNLNMQKSTN